jgi:hypothetical protein
VYDLAVIPGEATKRVVMLSEAKHLSGLRTASENALPAIPV